MQHPLSAKISTYFADKWQLLGIVRLRIKATEFSSFMPKKFAAYELNHILTSFINSLFLKQCDRNQFFW
jgi:hypothetical protein